MPNPSTFETSNLVKHSLAEELRKEIIVGSLKPGMRIVEGTWGKKFGVAQGSVREALNILAVEGFVSKEQGRSARVIHFTELDVLQLYEVRGVLEGLAARLAANCKPDFALLRIAMENLRIAARAGGGVDLIDCDLQFHLEICRLSGNPHLLDHARRILVPFFAFVRIRVAVSGDETSSWGQDIDAHQRIFDLISDGEGEVAEQYVKKAMTRFSQSAQENWDKRVVEGKRSRRRSAQSQSAKEVAER